jgi:hypothetical protein
MPAFRDRSGEKVGRLTILCEAADRIGGRVTWHCRCECGNEVKRPGRDLYLGRTTSCGCLLSESISSINVSRTKHGHSKSGGRNIRLTTPEYRSWKAMLERCRNPNAPNYHLYGGRGISICDRWLGADGFVNFHADMGDRPEGQTLDRIDTNGDYTPENCQWATAKQQSNNRRNTEVLAAARHENLKKGRKHWPRKP